MAHSVLNQCIVLTHLSADKIQTAARFLQLFIIFPGIKLRAYSGRCMQTRFKLVSSQLVASCLTHFTITLI